jgi:carboxypeptidase T
MRATINSHRAPDPVFFKIEWKTTTARNALLASPLDVLHLDATRGYAIVRGDQKVLDTFRQHPTYLVSRQPHLEASYRERQQALRARFDTDPAGQYHTYEETRERLRTLTQTATGTTVHYKVLAQRSVQGRDIATIWIGRGTKHILITGCHHAREWISVEVPLHFAEYLLAPQSFGADSTEVARVRRLLDAVTFIVCPMINPDGHTYTVQTGGDRLWRKNLRPGTGSAFGVDLNRNYSEGWAVGAPGASDDPADYTYRGPSAFSEPETRAIRDLINDLVANRTLAGVLNFHSFSQLVLYPWGSRNPDPSDASLASLRLAAERYANEIRSASGTEYTPEQASALYVATGASDDWVWAISQGAVPSLTVELRPHSEDPGFLLPEDEIKPTCDENRVAMLDLFERWTISNASFSMQNPKTRPGPSTYASEPTGTLEQVGGDAGSAAQAITAPDEYAWRLFFGLNRQAHLSHRGEPDPAADGISKYDPDRSVVWETWALASGGIAQSKPNTARMPNVSEVFKSPAVKPVAWSELPSQAGLKTRMEPFILQQEIANHGARSGSPSPLFIDPSVASEDGTEVRMNRETYEHIREQNLFSIEGLRDAYRKARDQQTIGAISFPTGAKEIKAHWKIITPDQKSRYHWRSTRTASNASSDEVWGLVGLHILTKDLPNWFWCTFEHVDYERDAVDASRDSTVGSDHVRNETRNTKWQYYRLRGSQVDYTDSIGRPVVLANSLIEKGFQRTSSCMTCHSRATIADGLSETGDDRIKALDVFQAKSLRVGYVGTPRPDWFVNLTSDVPGDILYLPTDFLWSIPFRAHSIATPDHGKVHDY